MLEQCTPDENEQIFVQNIIAKRKERILSQKGLALTSHIHTKRYILSYRIHHLSYLVMLSCNVFFSIILAFIPTTQLKIM